MTGPLDAGQDELDALTPAEASFDLGLPAQEEAPVEYASWWRRLCALVVDETLAFWGAYAVLGLIFTSFTVPEGDLRTLYVLLLLTLFPLYFALNHPGRWGRTVGEWLFGIAVRDAHTLRRLGYGKALARTLVTVCLYLSVIGLLVSGLFALADARQRSISDRAVGSTVVRVRRLRRRSWQERFGVQAGGLEVS